MRIKKVVAGILAAAMVVPMAFPATVSIDVQAAANGSEEWNALKEKLGNYSANWTDANLKNAVSQRMIETALMGNGDVGANSAGSYQEKSYLISKQDFWNCGNMNTDNIGSADAKRVSPLSVGGMTIRGKREAEEIVEDPTISGCGYLRDAWNFDLDGIIDGSKADGNDTTWACKGEDHTDNPREHWFEIDLKKVKKLSGYRIFHNKSDNGSMITADFNVQLSKDGKTYETVQTIAENKEAVTDLKFDSVKEARYIRVNITKANSGRNDGIGRILEMEWDEALDRPETKVTGCGEIGQYDLGGILDGKMEHDGDTWACNHAGANGTHWFQVDFGKSYELKKYVLYHQGAYAQDQGPAMNTVDFEVFVSADGEHYESVQKVENNTADQTEFIFDEPQEVRFVKVEITKANTGKDTTAREAEMSFFDKDNVNIVTGEVKYDFHETLDIVDGALTTDMQIDGTPIQLENWVSATDNVMITEVTSKGDKPVEIEGALWTKADVKEFPLDAGAEDGKVWASKKSVNYVENQNDKSWTSEVVLKSKELGKDVETKKNSQKEAALVFTLEPGETVQIVTAVGGGGQNYDWQGNAQGENPAEEADEILAQYTTENNLQALKAENDSWWKDYWMKSYIDIGDELLHRYYYGSLYYMACTSRGDKLPSGLYGIWTTTDGAMWNGDYHMNYNFIAPFYGMYSSNRYEHAKSLKDPLLDFMEEGERRALTDLPNVYRNYIYGGNQPGENGSVWNNGKFDPRPELQNGIEDAVLYPVALGPWGSYTWGGKNGGYLMQAYDAGFPAMGLTAYYNYTKDGEYLKEIYPYLLANANFYEKWCEKEVFEDGTYRYNVWNGAHENTFDMNSGTTIGVVKNILECLIDGTEDGVLNPPAEKLAVWKDMYENFADYPIEQGYAPYNYEKPVIPLSEVGAKFRANEANVGLEFIAPGQQLGFDTDPVLREAARNSIELKEIANKNIWSQINETPKLYLYSIRSGVPAEYVIGKFKTLLDSSFKENFVIQDGYHGIEKAGAIEFINTMLLQSDKGIMKVFPNWTGEDASFKTLRERGAFLASSEMKSGEVEYVEITSEVGTDVKLVNPWGDEKVSVLDSEGNKVAYQTGRTVNTEENTIEFATEEGETYNIVKGKEGEEETADKTDLEALIDYAKLQQKDKDYPYVVPKVKNAFEAALKKAEEVTGKANPTLTEVEKAYDKLLKMVHMLDFTGNSTKLSDMIQQVKNLKEEHYTASTWSVFKTARTKANEVLADENSLQAEIDEARVALRNAIFGLRLIPDKGQLDSLIKTAEAVNTANYTVKSATAFAAALDNAKAVFADEEATEAEVKAAEAALEEAQKNLVAKENPEEDADKDVDEEAGSKADSNAADKADNKVASKDDNKADNKVASDNGNNQVASDNGSKKASDTSAAKTGDAGAALPAAVAGAAALAVVMALKKRR